jgi:hypothetical protein
MKACLSFDGWAFCCRISARNYTVSARKFDQNKVLLDLSLTPKAYEKKADQRN